MSWELAAYAVMAGAGIWAASEQPKPPQPATKGAPPAPQEGGPETGAKPRKYKPAAQLFKDEDLRLGGTGKLGMTA